MVTMTSAASLPSCGGEGEDDEVVDAAAASAALVFSDELGSCDEVKVFKDEGEGDDDLDGFNAITEELQAALLEDKSLLIQETENLSIKDELSAVLHGGGGGAAAAN